MRIVPPSTPDASAPPAVPRHDAGTYSVEAAKQLPFPRAGGATGSIRFKPEMSHGASESHSLMPDAQESRNFLSCARAACSGCQ